VEDQELHQLRRLHGLLPIELEPPPPPLRLRLDQQGSFKVTGPQETMPEPSLRGEHLNSEEPNVSDLGVESLGPSNSPITNLSVPIMVQVVPPRVTHHERQIFLQAAMEANAATSSGSAHTPSTTTTIGGILPPKPPSLVGTTMVSTTSTLGSGIVSSMATITTPFTQSATGPLFSYGMLGFDTNFILSYSTLQTMGLGARSSNDPLLSSAS
jgi:hypothetical protein